MVGTVGEDEVRDASSNGTTPTIRQPNGSIETTDGSVDKHYLNPHVIIVLRMFCSNLNARFFTNQLKFVSFFNRSHQMHRPSEVSLTMKDIIWTNVIYLAYLHLGAVYGFWLLITGQCKIATILMSEFIAIFYDFCERHFYKLNLFNFRVF